jgi:NOL1/NOP2/fmu family ribosome biogenesis protein
MRGDEASDGTGDSSGTESDRGAGIDRDAERSNDGQRFDRLPATAGERRVEGRATREAVLDWWDGRFAIPPERFERFTFWEKGAGKIWIFGGDAPSGVETEALGLTFLRTRQEHWKPTTDAVQRFGRAASRNVIELDREAARRFAAGEDQAIGWGGDWGYLIAAHGLAGEPEPLGIGLYLHGELRSQIPKGRRRELR